MTRLLTTFLTELIDGESNTFPLKSHSLGDKLPLN